MEKISWTDHVRNEEVLLRVNEQRNILHEIRKRKANWIGHILRRNCRCTLPMYPPGGTEPNLIEIPSAVSEAKYEARYKVRVRCLRRALCAKQAQA